MILSLGQNQYRCDVCNLVITTTVLPITCCATGTSRPRGCGDYLHDAILQWVGESQTNDCQCSSRIAQMNAWGPSGCREHLEEIVGRLVEQAKEYKWVSTTTDADGDEVVTEVAPPLLARFGRWLAKGKHRQVLLKVACRRMVLQAIKKAETTQPHNDSTV